MDVAGTVEAVGPGVTRFKPGDRVFGDLLPFDMGSFAELVVAKEKAFLPIPDGIDFDTAATLPHAAVLAIQGLRTRHGRTIKPGDRVLVDGASGNVGPFAVQIAKWKGAEVTGVCRTEKVEFVRSLGADHVLDYRTTDFTKQPERYDWIIASDSHHSIRSVRRALKPGGQYATLGGGSKDIIEAMVIGKLSSIGSRQVGRDHAVVEAVPRAGRPDAHRARPRRARSSPRSTRVYPLDQTREALERVHNGESQGKVLIRVLPAEA